MTKRTPQDEQIIRDYITEEINRLTESKNQANDLIDELSVDNQCDRILLINRRDSADTKIKGLRRYLAELS